MCSKCPLWVISRARRDGDAMHWLMTRDTPRGGLWIICQNDCNNDNGPIFSIRLITVAVSVLQDVIIASLVRLLHGLRWKSNSNCVLSWLSNKSSKFYKISSFLNKIMLKKFAEFVFFVWTQRSKLNNNANNATPCFDWVECSRQSVVVVNFNNFRGVQEIAKIRELLRIFLNNSRSWIFIRWPDLWPAFPWFAAGHPICSDMAPTVMGKSKSRLSHPWWVDLTTRRFYSKARDLVWISRLIVIWFAIWNKITELSVTTVEALVLQMGYNA